MPDPYLLETDFQHYLMRLGMFISQYASLESHLRGILEQLVETPPDVLRVLIGSPAIGEVVNKIRALVKLPGHLALSDDEKDQITEAFDHLDKIARMRDRLIHQGARMLAPGQLFILPKGFNELTDHTEHLHDLGLLLDMHNDIQLIQTKFMYFFATDRTAEWLKTFPVPARTPWHSKFPQSKTPGRLPRTKPR